MKTLLSLRLSINATNAAFDESPERETARILRDLAEKLERGERPHILRDINGNRVGETDYFIGEG